MKKVDAINIIVTSAKAYRDNLVNRNFLFVFGRENDLDCFEAVFLPRHFKHLTGVVGPNEEQSSVNFYDMCLSGKLSPTAFDLNKDGTTRMKLLVLNQLMSIHAIAKMAGDHSDTGVKLYTEKIVGTTAACMGFVRESGSSDLFVPKAVLSVDTRTVVQKPAKKILAIYTKPKSKVLFSECTYMAKGIVAKDILMDEGFRKQCKTNSEP